jgi:hypothetical protein
LYRELELRERLVGSENALTAASKFNLAMLLAHRVEHEAAAKLFGEVLAVRRRVLGPEHREVGVTLLALAMTLSELGDNREAQKLALEGIEIFGKQPGAERLGKAVGFFVQGLVTRRTGFPKLAEPLFRQCLSLAQAELGQRHFYIVFILHELAVTLDEAGRPDEPSRCSARRSRWASDRGTGPPASLIGVTTIAEFLERRGKSKEVARCSRTC